MEKREWIQTEEIIVVF